MKQIIGYIEYDYMNLKQGFWYLLLIFGIASGIFAMKDGTGAMVYMLFGGMILASTAFSATKQTVAFTALVPGSTLQKVLGRYLSGILNIIVCVVIGVIAIGAVEMAGYGKGSLEFSVLPILIGITFLFLAVQNVLLYLLLPHIGVQFIGLIRMLPGFVLFFGSMYGNSLELLSGFAVRCGGFLGIIALGIGIIGQLISIGFSCLIIRNRDNE